MKNSGQYQPVSSELAGVDDTIDAIAQQVLEEARRMEAERYRRNPGPVVPPQL
jgi:hypothetical protein